MRALQWPSILIATTNPGKIREIRAILDGLPVRWLALNDVAEVPEPDESGATFAENAWIKARAYAEASRLPTVAEDSGLEIDALGGRPGVLSARYPGATYPEKFEHLYGELAGHPRPWTARFVSALAFVAPEWWPLPEVGDLAQARLRAARPAFGARDREWRAAQGPPHRAAADTALFACEGIVSGAIAAAPRGQNGFGYDPIFEYEPDGRTGGELSDKEKLARSHRGQAFRQWRGWLGVGEG